MAQYVISPRSESNFESFTVEASSYNEAAALAARKINGRRAWASRVTGIGNKSGVFQAYVNVSGGKVEASSVGGNFHVAEC